MATIAELEKYVGGYLTIADVQGSEPVLTVSKATVEEVGRDKEMKPVLEFVEIQKKLVLNKTRIAQLRGLFNTGDPAGNKITLSVDSEGGRAQISVGAAD